MNGKPWTEAEVKALSQLYPSKPTAEIAKTLGTSVSRVHLKANQMGIRKTPEYLKRFCRIPKGRTIPGSERYQFQKGRIPANKGLRRPGWYAGRMKETQFKKGQMAGAAKKKWCPVGTIKPDADGYLHIKVRERADPKLERGWHPQVWPCLHHVVWEQHNGPIPPKHYVRFKDGDPSNCAIDNLYLISTADNARRNSIWATLPRELALAIQLNGALKRRLRKLDGKKQD